MVSDDAFIERLRKTAAVRDRVRKLLALADKHPDTPEGKSAREKAGKLIAKHHLHSEDLRPPPKISRPDTFDQFNVFAGAINRFAPAKDTEDYSKYGKDDE